ncbi:MAG: hypothetical protein WC614_04570 [bacterium]
MKAQNDTLTREESLALCVFLYAEKQRHGEDIRMIDGALTQLKCKYSVSSDEWKSIKKKSKRYVTF